MRELTENTEQICDKIHQKWRCFNMKFLEFFIQTKAILLSFGFIISTDMEQFRFKSVLFVNFKYHRNVFCFVWFGNERDRERERERKKRIITLVFHIFERKMLVLKKEPLMPTRGNSSFDSIFFSIALSLARSLPSMGWLSRFKWRIYISSASHIAYDLTYDPV